MKILVTGSTRRQTGAKCKVQKINDMAIIVQGLREIGYEVDWKKPSFNMDLKGYDLAIIGIGQFNSFNSMLINEALFLIDKIPCILYFEDWQITSFMKSIESISKNSNQLMRGFYESVGELSLTDFKNLVHNIQSLNTKVEPNVHALIPAFEWGNKRKVLKILKSFKTIDSIDLTPYAIDSRILNRDFIPFKKMEDRKHKWFLASLQGHESWIKKRHLNFMFDSYGTKGNRLETEYDVFLKLGEYVGNLCPQYPQEGSGWFRSRFIYSAYSDSILTTTGLDTQVLGDTFNYTTSQVENSSNSELEKIAKGQKEVILKYVTTKDQFISKLQKIISSI